MQIIINIVATFILAFWPLMFMMSPMMFDAPGSENSKTTIISMMLILCYPIILFLLLGIFGINYFGVNSFKLAQISAVVIAIAFLLFGYYGLLFNALRGIASSGYSVVNDKAYYDGRAIKGADSQTFTIFKDKYRYSYSDYARDKHHLYCNGKVVEGALAEDVVAIENSEQMYWRNSQQVIYEDRILKGAVADRFIAYRGFTGWACSDNDDAFNVYSYGVLLPAVDKDSFKPFNDFYAKDKDHVFKKEKVILPEADAASFELMEDHDFGRDKNHVYYVSTKQPFVVKDADPASFEMLERGYARDRNHIYVIEQYEDVRILEQAHVDSFEVTQYDDATKSEARDVNHYYYDGKIVGAR